MFDDGWDIAFENFFLGLPEEFLKRIEILGQILVWEFQGGFFYVEAI